MTELETTIFGTSANRLIHHPKTSTLPRKMGELMPLASEAARRIRQRWAVRRPGVLSTTPPCRPKIACNEMQLTHGSSTGDGHYLEEGQIAQDLRVDQSVVA
ncbi:hypothetical protein NPIL_62471 [Nephila pilipes]|uniref:Uncharacterized protein n=1 Tax=Nephila pilipes TaxID=299642 RepID=A0A8X6MW15_NEPPI|nr:hypothetical protein NPIL_62471 [Nephila pilipes]